jgi:hypothetical protein
MSRSRSYPFRTSSGDVKIMTLQEAVSHLEDPEIKKKFDSILINSKNIRRKKRTDSLLDGRKIFRHMQAVRKSIHVS